MPSLVRHVRWSMVAMAAFLVVAACGGTTSSSSGGTSFKGDKKFAVSTDLSGAAANYGVSIQNALILGLKDINSQGGINGYRMVPDVIDDQSDVNKSVNNVKQFILQDNAVGMINPILSSQCQATSPVSKQNKFLSISSICNSYQLTDEPDLVNPYYVSVVPNTYMEGTAAGQVAAKTGAKRIFIVSPRYLFGISETNAFVASLKKLNPSAQIINDPSTWYVPYPPPARWDTTINQIQTLKPDLIYSNIFSSSLENFITQALATDPNFFKTYPMDSFTVIPDLETLKNQYPIGMHLYMRAPFMALNNAKMSAFISEWQNAYPGTYPADFSVMVYDALQMYATAARQAGSFDADAVLKKIVGHSFPSLRGYNYTIRASDQQANVGETIGTTVDSAGKFPFPTLSNPINLNGNDLIMPNNLVQELKSGQCEKGGVVTTTDFALCPSWKSS